MATAFPADTSLRRWGGWQLFAKVASMAFIVAIFYGDVELRLTVPLAMLLLLPVGIVVVIAGYRPSIPVGVYPLVALVLIPAAQAIFGPAAPAKPDLTIYLPLAYAVGSIVLASAIPLSENLIWRSLLLGGVLAVAALVITAIVLPAGEYPLAGQDTVHLQQQEALATKAHTAASRAAASAAATSPIAGAPGNPPASGRQTGTGPQPGSRPWPPDDAGQKAFYDLKDWARSPLGRSNYLAVFFVFIFAVALFRKSWWALLFAAATAATLSRFGIAFLVVIPALSIALHRGAKISCLLLALAIAIAGIVGITIVFDPDWSVVPLAQSIAARAELWQQGTRLLASQPLFGSPRSYLTNQLGYSLIWNPHNSVLWNGALFGLVGAAAYLLYAGIVLQSLYCRAKTSSTWMGIFVGISLLLIWSLTEIIVLAPAFEILLAAVYGLSLKRVGPAASDTLGQLNGSGAQDRSD